MHAKIETITRGGTNSGFHWTGLDWTGLDWTGLDWTAGLNCRWEALSPPYPC